MKQLWICVALLVALFLAALYSNAQLRRLTEELALPLEAVQAITDRGWANAQGQGGDEAGTLTDADWAEAETLIAAAKERWEKSLGWLYMTLRHDQLEEITAVFEEAAAFARTREDNEFAARSRGLLMRIRLLYEGEKLNLSNLL